MHWESASRATSSIAPVAGGFQRAKGEAHQLLTQLKHRISSDLNFFKTCPFSFGRKRFRSESGNEGQVHMMARQFDLQFWMLF